MPYVYLKGYKAPFLKKVWASCVRCMRMTGEIEPSVAIVHRDGDEQDVFTMLVCMECQSGMKNGDVFT